MTATKYTTFNVPLHARVVEVEGGYQGILRLDGATILYTDPKKPFPTPKTAADGAVGLQVRILRELNSFYGAFPGKDGVMRMTVSFTHENQEE